MIMKIRSFLRAVYLFPLSILLGNIATAVEVPAATDTPVLAAEEPVVLTPEEQAHSDAVARGDVLEIVEEPAISPEILAEIAAEEEPVAAAEVKKDDGAIPRARFNEINEENKRLKEQLEALSKPETPAAEAAQPAVEDPREKIKELRRQQKDLEIEGDVEAAALVGDQIDELILTVATSRATNSLKQENNAVKVQESLADVAAAAFTKYPFLDVDSPAADGDAVNAVIIRRNELIDAGKPIAEALQIAIDEKGPKFARILGTVQQPDGQTAAQIREAREKSAREKGANASISQPAVLPSKTEKDSFAVSVEDLTPAQINKMPEEQKAKLRGDVL